MNSVGLLITDSIHLRKQRTFPGKLECILKKKNVEVSGREENKGSRSLKIKERVSFGF